MKVVRLLSLVALVVVTSPVGASIASPAFALTPIVEAVEPVMLSFRNSDAALYVAERRGTVQRFGDGVSTPVLDIADLVGTGEHHGLLGLAFSADGRLAYVDFVDTHGDTVVAELAVGADGVFDRASLRVVIAIDQPHDDHHSGHLAIGPDGFLYISVGDGGGAGDPDRVGQSFITLLGKLLRIDPTPSAELGYTIPADNPYAQLAGLLDENWSLGLHDPWRFSFDPETGDLWVADRGVDTFEEVSVDPAIGGRDAGRNTNFGWSAYEGEQRFNNDMTAEQHRRPIYTYRHEHGRCAISGGVRARGDGAGELAGDYVFADYCSGEVLALPVSGSGEDLTAGVAVTLLRTTSPTAVVAGPDGTLYVLSVDAVNRLEVQGDG